ncbi:sulfur carrier protein ThiS [Hydrogenophaga sp. PAMC20947]|uniref:sulfur carrier protein ThiS n=1 Tax=Hydrogenophaga sp. PAMC20947 TaxID=2565558 RepID=UPI00109DEBEF|nr:sulfur carrier protein ThiS [Hydrogenophaga sp. PAMC20947]QCB44622.1 sulfur carrier protein ThiS [Hydrogenophaga sp. PAMC20947]
MSESFNVLVNGEQWPWQAGLQVAQVLESLGMPAKSVATALNGNFVPLTLREQTPLKPGDALTVFKAIVGG